MEIMTSRPVGMLESLVLTIGYTPDYAQENEALAVAAPDPVTIVIPQVFVERFLEDAQNIFGMDESVDFTDQDNGMFYSEDLERSLPYERNWCPFIINAMYVDMMGSIQVLDESQLDIAAQFPSAANLFANKR
ncbi:hypothetical protein VPHD239_0121 [Vibrio phage D239]